MLGSRGFASDNNASIHPEVLTALSRANSGHAIAYGGDSYTRKIEQKIADLFGIGTEHAQSPRVFFVFNGTGANVLSLQACAQPFEAVLATECAHVHVDECGAPEKHTGCKLITVPAPSGKLEIEHLEPYLHWKGVEHHAQPRVVTLTQSTELGTVYTLSELKRISAFCQANNLYLHMDGARLANAAASLGVAMETLTLGCGVDILSFGGTKNGLLLGEAIVVFHPELAQSLRYLRKQGMQLASKMRFISAQFDALLDNQLWLRNATRSNRMAQLLSQGLREFPEIKITHPVEANGIFAEVPRKLIAPLQKDFFFYVWDEGKSQVRWMCSFDTEEEDIQAFLSRVRSILRG